MSSSRLALRLNNSINLWETFFSFLTDYFLTAFIDDELSFQKSIAN